MRGDDLAARTARSSASSVSQACRIVSQSEREPMITPTSAFTAPIMTGDGASLRDVTVEARCRHGRPRVAATLGRARIWTTSSGSAASRSPSSTGSTLAGAPSAQPARCARPPPLGRSQRGGAGRPRSRRRRRQGRQLGERRRRSGDDRPPRGDGLRGTGAQFAEATLTDCTFADCRLDLTSFRFAQLERVVFRDCRLEEADFHGATLRSVRFERCVLDAVQTSRQRASTAARSAAVSSPS